MTSLYEQVVAVLGSPPNETIRYLYYVACVYILITSVKLLYTFIFKFLLNTKY